jgi:hypothetical protein
MRDDFVDLEAVEGMMTSKKFRHGFPRIGTDQKAVVDPSESVPTRG